MYEHITLPEIIRSTEAAITMPVVRHGVGVYVESNPDDVSPDIFIDPRDEKGIEIFREFAAKMVEHYKTISDGTATDH